MNTIQITFLCFSILSVYFFIFTRRSESHDFMPELLACLVMSGFVSGWVFVTLKIVEFLK